MDLNATEKSSTQLIWVRLEIREGALTYRVRVSTSSIERALKIAGGGKIGREVRLIFPIDSEDLSIPEVPSQDRAA
jgi:hypothetical protein